MDPIAAPASTSSPFLVHGDLDDFVGGVAEKALLQAALVVEPRGVENVNLKPLEFRMPRHFPAILSSTIVRSSSSQS